MRRRLLKSLPERDVKSRPLTCSCPTPICPKSPSSISSPTVKGSETGEDQQQQNEVVGDFLKTELSKEPALDERSSPIAIRGETSKDHQQQNKPGNLPRTELSRESALDERLSLTAIGGETNEDQQQQNKPGNVPRTELSRESALDKRSSPTAVGIENDEA